MVDAQIQAIRTEFAEELLQVISAGGDAYSRLGIIKQMLEDECRKTSKS